MTAWLNGINAVIVHARCCPCWEHSELAGAPHGGRLGPQLACDRWQIFEVHNVARRVQEIVREYALRTLGSLRPLEIARGMAAQPPYVLDVVHIGAHIGATPQWDAAWLHSVLLGREGLTQSAVAGTLLL